jgi:hypothetical protein
MALITRCVQPHTILTYVVRISTSEKYPEVEVNAHDERKKREKGYCDSAADNNPPTYSQSSTFFYNMTVLVIIF